MKLYIAISFIYVFFNIINTSFSQEIDEEEVIVESEIEKEIENLNEEEIREMKKELEEEIAELKEKDSNFVLPVKFQKEHKTPSLLVVNPVRRVGTTGAVADLEPCGGIPKDKADTLTNMGTKINAIWEVRQPIGGGNCTVSISSGLDVNFTALKPIGKSIVYDSEHTFACGRQEGFEFKQFELPDNFACDQCTLQLKWNTPLGKFYQCSDLMILGNKGKLKQ